MHGDERVDDWYWLRERDDPDVLAHLEAENAYAEAMLAPRRALRDRIFDEIKARVQETDDVGAGPDGPWEYYTRTIEGQQYALHCRRARGADADGGEQILLDENTRSRGLRLLRARRVRGRRPTTASLAYAVDITGGERLHVAVPRPAHRRRTSTTSSTT